MTRAVVWDTDRPVPLHVTGDHDDTDVYGLTPPEECDCSNAPAGHREDQCAE